MMFIVYIVLYSIIKYEVIFFLLNHFFTFLYCFSLWSTLFRRLPIVLELFFATAGIRGGPNFAVSCFPRVILALFELGETKCVCIGPIRLLLTIIISGKEVIHFEGCTQGNEWR